MMVLDSTEHVETASRQPLFVCFSDFSGSLDQEGQDVFTKLCKEENINRTFRLFFCIIWCPKVDTCCQTEIRLCSLVLSSLPTNSVLKLHGIALYIKVIHHISEK